MTLIRAFGFCAALVLAVHIAPLVQAQQGSAAQVIDAFHNTVLAVMRDAKRLGFAGRYEGLGPAVVNSFNLPLMTRIAVSTLHWRRMTPSQRERLLRAFTQFTVATYANRFDDYSGERFQTLGEQPARRESIVVQSEIVKSDGDRVRIDYLMQSSQSGWRVVDIFLKGAISELATRRSEYTSVINRRGYDGLIEAIERKSAELNSGN